jgi:hypothetical protein
MFARAVLAACLVAVAAGSEPAAPTPVVAASRAALVQALTAELAVNDERRQAWAAFEIGTRGLTEARAALLPLLGTVPLAGDERATRRYEVALDALTRLPGTTPPEVVADLAARRWTRDEALILAAREPEVHRATLEALLPVETGDAQWLAIRQLLVPLRSSPLAKELARELTLTLAVSVHDPHSGGGGARRTLAIGDGSIDVPDGFPPKAIYRLTLEPKPGAVVLCHGSRDVLWTRDEYASDSGIGSTSGDFDRQVARIDLLALLCGPRLVSTPTASTALGIEWRDGDDYRRRVTEARARLIDQRAELLAPLIESGLLPPDSERLFPPRVTVTVHDIRADRSTPLPDLVFPDPAPKAEF